MSPISGMQARGQYEHLSVQKEFEKEVDILLCHLKARPKLKQSNRLVARGELTKNWVCRTGDTFMESRQYSI